MKNSFCSGTRVVVAAILVMVGVWLQTGLIWAQVAQPVIASVQVMEGRLSVEVEVPAGVRRVTLESRTRLDAQTWVPVAVRQMDGGGGRLVFDLPRRETLEVLRVRADFQQALPQSFYLGTNAFGGPPTNAVGPWSFYDVVSGGPGRENDSDQREVVESDIWRIEGDRLYFFNQYRGLQVLDISDPDAAVLLGSLSMPAAGEQMYLADPDNVVLLARKGCYYGDESQILIVGVTNAVPELLKSLPVRGYLQESRMVGTALYVASQTYRPVTGTTNTTWEWGSLVTSFDLADPARPVLRSELWFPGYGQTVAATDTFFFIVTQDPTNWRRSEVRILDITAPDGTMEKYATVTTAGVVVDKFKMNYAGGIFTTIAEDAQSGTLVTRLETFRLADPRTLPAVRIERLGSLELGHGERLHATRFDGSKVYVVTFFQIDPLWVVDLSDPARPRIAGALEIPGWSTYIKPLGNRLVSVGIETNRVAVSLFDVTDPANPGLLSRVLLGQNHSWTEANYDEKAFSVLETERLILVPYSGDTTNGWTSRVQLIDLLPDKLAARGLIEHEFQPRRATYSHGRVLSLSGSSLLSVDVADRDQPEVTGETVLSWSVDRVLLKGDYVLQIGNGDAWWFGQQQAWLRVSDQADPDRLLSAHELGPLSVGGAVLANDHLYIVQTRDAWESPDGGKTNSPNFVLSVYDVSRLPEISLVGRTEARVSLQGGSSGWEAVWPKPGILVLAGGGGSYWRWGPWFDGPFMGRGFWPGFTVNGGHLLCFDVGSSPTPKLLSEVNLNTNSWWDFSPPFLSGTQVYLSHAASDQLGEDPRTGWIQRSFLDVIDYADPANPTIRKPVNIPGQLTAVTHNGELLYTKGVHWTTNQTDWREWVDASAYDGISAHLVASLALPDNWPRPALVAGDAVLVGRSRPGTSGEEPTYEIESWTLDPKGEFLRVAVLRVPTLVNAMVLRGGLLATQDYNTQLQFFDATDPFSLLLVGKAASEACLWFDINAGQGSLADGLWVPLGAYGVLHAPLGGP